MDRNYYQKKAMECLAVAESIREPAKRLGLLNIAQQFLRLATHVAARHRGPPHDLPKA